jgi:integrase
MRGRPITGEEFERMLDAIPKIVGKGAAQSWEFTLRVLWESGFRVGDVMDFCWDDDRHIRPHWPSSGDNLPTISIPSSQKNGRVQEIPMLPGLVELLQAVPLSNRSGWVVNPMPPQVAAESSAAIRPLGRDLRYLVSRLSNCDIAKLCGVSETAVRKWLRAEGIRRPSERAASASEVPSDQLAEIRNRSSRSGRLRSGLSTARLTKERVGRIISLVGKEAGVVVVKDDSRTGRRRKYASAHDLRRGCAHRLINAGVTAETLKVVMRHCDFATTEKHYGAIRSAQVAASEVHAKLAHTASPHSFVGGLMGGDKAAPQLNAEELKKLRCLLNAL